MASSSSSPCAACKFLRRKCQPECVFAPYFPPDQPHKFANVHRIFGASNVSKLLNDLQPDQREDAVSSLAYEAHMRLRDPINGCVGVISILQHQLRQLQMDLFLAKYELSKIQNFGPGRTGQSLVAAASNTAATTIHHQMTNMNGGGLGRTGQSLVATAASNTAATTNIHHHMTSMNGGGGCDSYLHRRHQHQFFPKDVVWNFDSGNCYETNVLAMNVSSTASFGQLNQLQLPNAAASFGPINQLQLPSVAAVDDSHIVEPS